MMLVASDALLVDSGLKSDIGEVSALVLLLAFDVYPINCRVVSSMIMIYKGKSRP